LNEIARVNRINNLCQAVMFNMSGTLIIIYSSRGKISHNSEDIPLGQTDYILDSASASGKLLRKFKISSNLLGQ